MTSKFYTVVIATLALAAVFLAGRQSTLSSVPPAEVADPAVALDGPPVNGLVALLTDYGTGDLYAGVLRGAVLNTNPAARVLDLTHDIPNFDAVSAAYVLNRASRVWPPGTTFLVVVDPGVGTDRKMLAARTWPDGHRWVAPDNGVLTDVLARAERVEVRTITNPALRWPGADESSTFHGRDWFGPVAGHISGGLPLAEVGEICTAPVGLVRQAAAAAADGIVGQVIYVDHYGNLLTNIPAALVREVGLAAAARLRLAFDGGPTVTAPRVRTYADVPVGELMSTIDNGPQQLEVAINRGDAAAALGIAPGTVLRVGAASEE